jgi:hypothetical protein
VYLSIAVSGDICIDLIDTPYKLFIVLAHRHRAIMEAGTIQTRQLALSRQGESIEPEVDENSLA